MIVERWQPSRPSNPDLARGEAIDVAVAGNRPALFDRLVRLRGWSARRFEKWLGQMLVQQLVVG